MSEEMSTPRGWLMIEGKVFPLEIEETNIGRGEKNELVTMDLRVSRTHAKISLVNGRYLLVDLNSSGGTYVNGRPMIQRLLQSGDVILLASTFKMVFIMGGKDRLPPTAPTYQRVADSQGSLAQTSSLNMPEDEDEETPD